MPRGSRWLFSSANDRGRLNSFDRLFRITLRRGWSRWAGVFVIVKPETAVAWHRAGFRLYWRWRSRAHGGRPKITNEIREVIAAFDFFSVPAVTFKPLYRFFVIQHGRRRIPHFNVFDRDSKFDADVIAFLKATGLKPKQTSVQAPWQNGIAARSSRSRRPGRQ